MLVYQKREDWTLLSRATMGEPHWGSVLSNRAKRQTKRDKALGGDVRDKRSRWPERWKLKLCLDCPYLYSIPTEYMVGLPTPLGICWRRDHKGMLG